MCRWGWEEDDSWSPVTHEEYQVLSDLYTYQIRIKPVDVGKVDLIQLYKQKLPEV